MKAYAKLIGSGIGLLLLVALVGCSETQPGNDKSSSPAIASTQNAPSVPAGATQTPQNDIRTLQGEAAKNQQTINEAQKAVNILNH